MLQWKIPLVQVAISVQTWWEHLSLYLNTVAIYSTENSDLFADSFDIKDIKEIEECYGKPFDFPKDPVHSQTVERAVKLVTEHFPM